ncbi:MAG: cohesin domain-containing protein [Candidatus Methanoperedens sp.]|nr:cohesin domain-containing protein [Candidatus Methanoperedens sp.]
MKTKISRMVGNLTIPFLIFCVLTTISIGVVQAASVSIEPSSKSVNRTDTFSVNVVVDPAGQAVMGVQIKLNFDKSVVNLNSAVPGTFLGNSPILFNNTIDNTNGKLELAYNIAGGDSAKSVKGTFATLTFTVRSDAPNGTSNLDLTMAKLTDASADPIAGVTINDGTVTVLSAPSNGDGGGGITSSTVRIEPSSKTVNRTDTFSVNVVVYPAGQAVMGVQIKLNFDKSVVNLNSAVPGTFLGSSPILFNNTIDNTNGILELGYTIAGTDSAKTANGTFATLTFKVKSNAPNGTSNLDLTMAKLTNASADTIPGVIMDDGQVIVETGTTLPPPQPSRTISWKFISVPYQLENSTVANVTKGIQYDGLFGFDPVNKVYVGGVTNFEPLKGYLIHMNTSQDITNLVRKSGQPSVPPSIDVKKGWNLIGTSGTDPNNAETMLGAIDLSYYSIWNFDVSTQSYDKIGVNGWSGPDSATHVSTVNFTMQPKVSYWVWATQDTSLPAYSP